MRFGVCFNGQVSEILLMVGPHAKPPMKKQGQKDHHSRAKAEPHEVKAPPQRKDQPEQADRISMLEARFSTMERRQESLEHRVDTSFDQVNNQLRQILAAVAPRSMENPTTGCTPPPKAAKTG